MKKWRVAVWLGMVLPWLAACKKEEVLSACFPAVVLDQDCGTVLAILDVRAAEIVNTTPRHDTVYVNTFDLHPIYQVKGKKLYITLKPVPLNEIPQCPGFTPDTYPHIKITSLQETPCS